MHKKIYLFSLSSHPKATHINSLDIQFFKPEIDFSLYDYLIITYEVIQNYPQEKKWLYLRAKEVASDFVQRAREEGYLIDEAVLYATQCSKQIASVEVEEDATLIFTSPSSVKCFLKSHQISEKNRVIVIGKTTAKSLPSSVHYSVAEEPTIESCFALFTL